jgi:hypothetical protein
MADISIEFYAAPDELREFLRQAVSDFGLYVTEIRFPPYQAVELDPLRLDTPWGYTSPYQELVFTIQKPNLPEKKGIEFVDKNPAMMRLLVGGRSEDGLVESWLSARTDDKPSLAVWRKIAKRLKEITTKGVMGFNPRNGVSGPISRLRYTAGAKALQCEGVPMITSNGILLKFDEEPS